MSSRVLLLALGPAGNSSLSSTSPQWQHTKRGGIAQRTARYGALIGAEVLASRLQPQDTRSSDSRTRDLGTWAPSLFSSSAPPTHSIALPIFLYVKYFCRGCAWQQLTQTAQHPGSQQRQHPSRPRPHSLGGTAEHSPRPGPQQHPTGPGLGLIEVYQSLHLLVSPGDLTRTDFPLKCPGYWAGIVLAHVQGQNPQLNKRHGFKTCSVSDSRWLKLRSADDKRRAARPDLALPSLFYTSPLQCRRLPELKPLSLVSLVLETWNEKERDLKGHNLMHLPAIFSETSCVTLHFKLTSLLL